MAFILSKINLFSLQNDRLLFLIKITTKKINLQLSGMRSDRVSIEQAHQMMLKYFASGYNLNQVVEQFKQSRSSMVVLQSLKQSLKEILIELEGEIYMAKYIKTLRIYDNINVTKIKDQIIHLSDILNAQTGFDFLIYYKYKHQFVILSRNQLIEVPVQPVTSKKKYAIYEAFLDYFQIKGAFDKKIFFQIPSKGHQELESMHNQYSSQEMRQILQWYEKYGGSVDQICEKLKQRGYEYKKYEKNRIRELLIENIAIGIGRVYKLSNNLEKFSGCPWNKFKKIHINMMKSFSFSEKLKMLKAAILDSIQDIEVYEMCQKIGIRYRPVGYPKWVKDNSHVNLYKSEKQSVISIIRNEMRGIMSSELRKSKKTQKQYEQL